METQEASPESISHGGFPDLAPQLEEARQNLERLNERVMAFARERPVTCIVGALALGFVVGKIAARY